MRGAEVAMLSIKWKMKSVNGIIKSRNQDFCELVKCDLIVERMKL